MSSSSSVQDSMKIEQDLDRINYSNADRSRVAKTPQISNIRDQQPKRASFSQIQHRFPIYNDEKYQKDPFGGAKRAFLAAHRRKGELAFDIQNRTWRTQEKSRTWAYKREIDLLTTNVKLRDDETLRRQYKARPKKGEKFVPNTTGPRLMKKLPRDVQNSQYPRNHTLYFGP